MKSATIALILLNIAIFILSPFGLDAQTFVNDYGFSTNNALAKPWTWVTSLFIHASLLHILYNMLGLFFFGRSLENEIGSQKFLLVYFIGGFAASIASILVLPAEILSVGASGAVFAVIAAGDSRNNLCAFCHNIVFHRNVNHNKQRRTLWRSYFWYGLWY